MAHPEIPSRPCSNPLAGMVLLVAAAALFSSAAPAHHASGEDLARQAAARIRSGIPEVERQLAVDLLIGLGDDAFPVIETLAASNDPIERAAALEILSGRAREAARFLPFLDDPSYYVRKTALEGILNAGDGGTAWNQIVAMLDDPFWPVRRAAVRALAAWPEPGSARYLFEAMEDPDTMVSASALRLMDQLREEIPPQAFRDASAGLSNRETLAFLKACLPLVREGNRAYFQERADGEQGTAPGVLALCVATSLTRNLPEDQLPYLVEQALEGDTESIKFASLMLTLAGKKVVPVIRDRLEKAPGAFPPTHNALVFLLLSLLEEEAVPLLASWTLDRSFPEEVREACLDGLTARDWETGARALTRIYPDLEEKLTRRAVRKAFGLVGTPAATFVAPLLMDALENPPDSGAARKAFAGLCLLPDPPVEALARIFEEEQNSGQRISYARNLVNAAMGQNRAKVAALLFEEIRSRRPAAVAVASELHMVADETMASNAVEPVRLLMEGEEDLRIRETLLVALIHLDNAQADRIVAEAMEEVLDGTWNLSLEFIVKNLGEGGGAATADLLYRIFPEASQDVKKQILRTLVMRSDSRAAELIEGVFAFTTLSYRRSIIDALASSGLSGACGELLRRIVMMEKDPALLSSAIEATPLPVLKNLEPRLIELAELGSELGMDTVVAVFNAIGRVGDPAGISYLHGKAGAFIEGSAPVPRDFQDGQAADLARTAAGSLARIRDRKAPAYLAELLFLEAATFRDQGILALWKAQAEGGIESKTHKWARDVLSSLLAFEDPVVEPAVFSVMDGWKKDGRLYQCGDALFGTLCRELHERKRCPALASRLADLTLSCAPAYSPSDFRIHLLQARRAEARGDHEAAYTALAAANHIMKFYTPARVVVRQEMGDPDFFQGYVPAAALASDMHRLKAIVLDAKGEHGRAAEELEQARRWSPFIR